MKWRRKVPNEDDLIRVDEERRILNTILRRNLNVLRTSLGESAYYTRHCGKAEGNQVLEEEESS